MYGERVERFLTNEIQKFTINVWRAHVLHLLIIASFSLRLFHCVFFIASFSLRHFHCVILLSHFYRYFELFYGIDIASFLLRVISIASFSLRHFHCVNFIAQRVVVAIPTSSTAFDRDTSFVLWKAQEKKSTIPSHINNNRKRHN